MARQGAKAIARGSHADEIGYVGSIFSALSLSTKANQQDQSPKFCLTAH